MEESKQTLMKVNMTEQPETRKQDGGKGLPHKVVAQTKTEIKMNLPSENLGILLWVSNQIQQVKHET